MTAARPVFNLNLFSNVASADPARCLAGHAARSFIDAFAPQASHDLRIRLFCDPNPHPGAWDAWVQAVRDALPGHDVQAIATRGLADGYLRSLDAEGPVACQLEHDFVFLPDRIGHSLPQLLAAMAAGGVTHLRFNKRWNRPVGYDAFMDPVTPAGVPLCRVPGRSNNPHLLDLSHARAQVAPWIDRAATRAAGIEGRVELYAGGGHVYGGPGWPATVGHLDGRALRWRDGLRRRLYLARKAA